MQMCLQGSKYSMSTSDQSLYFLQLTPRTGFMKDLSPDLQLLSIDPYSLMSQADV